MACSSSPKSSVGCHGLPSPGQQHLQPPGMTFDGQRMRHPRKDIEGHGEQRRCRRQRQREYPAERLASSFRARGRHRPASLQAAGEGAMPGGGERGEAGVAEREILVEPSAFELRSTGSSSLDRDVAAFGLGNRPCSHPWDPQTLSWGACRNPVLREGPAEAAHCPPHRCGFPLRFWNLSARSRDSRGSSSPPQPRGGGAAENEPRE